MPYGLLAGQVLLRYNLFPRALMEDDIAALQ